MKKAYLAIGFQNRKLLEAETVIIRETLLSLQIHLFIFVDAYHFGTGQEKEMMQAAFHEIDHCDLLLAEVSEKAIGVGIEIGYAVAKQKPVIYLRKAGAEHSTTAAGSATEQIIYQNGADLAEKLINTLQAC